MHHKEQPAASFTINIIKLIFLRLKLFVLGRELKNECQVCANHFWFNVFVIKACQVDWQRGLYRYHSKCKALKSIHTTKRGDLLLL